jgi:hypothetical protein
MSNDIIDAKEVIKNSENIQINKDSYFMNIFFICWIFIGAVGALDTYFTVKFRNFMKEQEQNPIARIIMSIDQWDVSGFIGIKMFTTIVVLGFLMFAFKKHAKYGLVFAVSLAVFQALLLFYFLF